jgi:hypothetical protein
LSRGVSGDDHANFHLLARFEQRAAMPTMLTDSTWLPQRRRGDE